VTALRIIHATAAAGLMTLAIVGACFVGGFDVDPAVGGGTTSTATAGGGGSGGSGGSDTCSHETWPGPPAAADPGPDDVDFVVAARSIDFGETDISNGPLVGLDLDGRCTCQGEGDSCNEPDWATADHCDGPAGRDNAIAQLFHDLGSVDKDFTSTEYTEAAEDGDDSLLLRVRHYNGQPNDDQVSVSLHPSQGTDDDPCNPPGTTPNWDGNDLWSINAASLNGSAGGGGAGGQTGGGGAGGAGGGGSAPSCGHNGYDIDDARYVDVNAYVSGGILVASLPEVALEFTSGDDSLPVVLKAGFLAGRLEQEGSGWFLREGIVAGRWTLAEFFKMIGSITAQQEPVCTDTSVYPLLKHALCQYPDIASELAGPTEPCDALSFGMLIEAEPAQIGSVLPPFGHPRLCPAETDPMYDSCDNPTD